MSRIVDLWQQGTAPGVSALYRADGSAYKAYVDGADLSYFRVGKALDLDALLTADPDNVTHIDECARAVLPNGSGYVCCGDGAHGSEGFFALVNNREELVWIVFLHNSNPFHRIDVAGKMATITNNLGKTLTINLVDDIYA